MISPTTTLQRDRPTAGKAHHSTARAAATALALWAAASFGSESAEHARVQVDAGKLQGTVESGIAAFKGIPYAAPPVNALRWRPPQPAEPWQGTRRANSYGHDCLQNSFGGTPRGSDSEDSSQPMSEDCLYLNVWTPARRGDSKLPVMIWFHGGGLTQGSSSEAKSEGSALARKGVVVVSFNYRLGRFGFFAHPSLAGEHPDEPQGNFGFMDQVAALQWVHSNIAAFGGDPNEVTIFGQSAGGNSVLRMMLAPQAVGLFKRAIVQSGGGRDRIDQKPPTLAEAMQMGTAFAHRAGVTSENPATLRAIPASVVLGKLAMGSREPDYPGVMIDGRIVTADIGTAFARGQQARVALLVGATDNELGKMPAGMAGQQTQAIIARSGPRKDDLSHHYGPGKGKPADLINDLAFVEPARFIAAAHASIGAAVWHYRFSYVAEVRRSQQQGAYHASDVPYFFDNLAAADFEARDADRRMADTVSDYWVAFATSGDPNGTGRPDWPKYSAARDETLELANPGARVVAGLDRERLDLIASYYAERKTD